jgi:thiosulfate reductase cytochrome b subunit
MADSVIPATGFPKAQTVEARAGHSALVRITHWIAALCFFALLVTGVEILLSHPRFYWGITGNVLTKPAFRLPVPSSRDMVPTGYSYVLPDQNGWSRYLHVEAAWLVTLAGLIYVVWGLVSGHFRRNLLPGASREKWKAILLDHVRFRRPDASDGPLYNPLQRLAYFCVVFVLFPLIIWTGLAMSPTFDGAFPWIADAVGGRQSARTIHFFDAIALTLFVIIHVVMVARSGFLRRTRAMIVGSPKPEKSEEGLS